MKTLKFILSFRKRTYVSDSILPVSKQSLDRLTSSLHKMIILCFDKVGSLKGRLVIANNFIQFIFKMNKNHGSTFTIKWLKACTVSLQKWLGEDRLKSLRDLEPNLPLPRLINGCPAIINRHDRLLMKSGNKSLIRFWHSLFSIYRVLKIPGKLKLETIYSPFSGDINSLNNAINFVKLTKWPSHLEEVALRQNLAPTSFHFSGKASPSNVNSSNGLITDVYLLLAHSEGSEVFSNILNYLNVLQKKWNTKLFLERLDSMKDLIINLPEDSLPIKKSMVSPFGQFAIKEESAGKLRVFALVDTVTQSLMKPLHLALFEILKRLPNDGTFDQNKSVQRCSEKALKFNKAYSFDLSAATDRLPVSLTAAIIESLFKIDDLGIAWTKVMIERNFSFTKYSVSKYGIEHPTLRYAVGQPMGCLSSWAGLAITHHWIMQFCSFLITKNWKWEERYEVLGDDIVIFDSDLANTYTDVMKHLGLEINFTKSLISPNKPVFEFAKRTVMGQELVSGITFSQINSCNQTSSRLNNIFNWISLGYIHNLSTITLLINNFKNKLNDYSLRSGSFALLGQSKIEHSTLIKSLVNPSKGVMWDLDTDEFNVPSRLLINMARDLITKGETELSLSREENREEWFQEGEHLIVAGILGKVLHDSRILSRDYLDQLKDWSYNLVIKDKLDNLQLAQVTGLLEELVNDDFHSRNDPFEFEDKIEKLLIYHAKTLKVTLEEAFNMREEITKLIYLYKQPTRISSKLYDRLSNNILKDSISPFFMKGAHYWEIHSPNQY